MSWIANVIRRTAAREGSYASLNPNSDGAGLSFGILQWTQASGNLGKLLATMYGMDPAAFVRIFGSLWQALLAARRPASARSAAPTSGRSRGRRASAKPATTPPSSARRTTSRRPTSTCKPRSPSPAHWA